MKPRENTRFTFSHLQSDHGQALLESVIATASLSLATILLVASFWFVFIYWGCKASLYEYLLCRASIHVGREVTCKGIFLQRVKRFSLSLVEFEVTDFDSSRKISSQLIVQSRFSFLGKMHWRLTDSVKIPLLHSQESSQLNSQVGQP